MAVIKSPVNVRRLVFDVNEFRTGPSAMAVVSGGNRCRVIGCGFPTEAWQDGKFNWRSLRGRLRYRSGACGGHGSPEGE
ncbi:hypothetical protein Poly24_35670 [Rosistilla carotiformis]|uniref:Uncharacterized protein n=1 Tax=Rosistilla carotiformis TaxID=2528017 RepID=A0A518JWC8_9BACT|nr:hypothetical protein Poly24_35670 [Rosistilla carotiformis]